MEYLTWFHSTEELTPIEIALGIDEDGNTTARKLYEFLELDSGNYARWLQVNIKDNNFAEANVDYFLLMKEENQRKKFSKPKSVKGSIEDYKLTSSFAKKLAMQAKNAKGELARKYFIAVEEHLKRVIGTKEDPRIIRALSKERRRNLTDALKESGLNEKMHGFGYKTFTDLIYKLVLNMNAKQYREAFGLDKDANVREYVNQYQLYEIGRLEKAAQSMIDIGMNYDDIKKLLTDKFIPKLTSESEEENVF